MTVRRCPPVRPWSATLAVVVALALGACGTAGGRPDRESTHPVVVGVGDSITVIATPAIRRALGPRVDETIVAESGRRTDEMVARLRAALRRRAPVDAVFLNLGTNDSIQARGTEAAMAGFEELLRATRGVPCVILTTVSTLVDDRFGGTVAADLNVRIRELQREHDDRYQAVDWDAAVRAPGGVATLMDTPSEPGDGVHENHGAGARWFADRYAEAVSACPPPERP